MLEKYAVKKKLEQIILYIYMIFQEKTFPASNIESASWVAERIYSLLSKLPQTSSWWKRLA